MGLNLDRHSGAREAESITTTGRMDSGPAPRGASRNDGEVVSGSPDERSDIRDIVGQAPFLEICQPLFARGENPALSQEDMGPTPDVASLIRATLAF
jgi:hypothetical protein